MPTSLPWTVPTRVGSIIVNGLTSSSQYISSFAVEVYADAALTDLVATKTSPAKWNGTKSVQTEPMTFSGLPMTNTYWLRAGTASTHSPHTSWTTPFEANLEEDSLIEGITYGGTFTATSSGVSYQVRPSGAPANLDHYEMIYKINDSSTPATLDTPHWKGVSDQSGILTFGAVAAPDQTVRLWLRGVDTALNYQPWTLVSTIDVTAFGIGTLDQLPNGLTFGRTLASGLTGGVPDPRKTTGILKLGSLNPAWSGTLFWSATASTGPTGSVAFWWDQIVVKRIDGTQTVVGSRASSTPLTVTGLATSTSGFTVVYDFYPYIDDFANAVAFLSGGDGGGSPDYAWSDQALTESTATTNSQQMNRQDRLGLGPLQVSMPIYSGGTTTSGGGGGFGGTCPRGDQIVHVFGKGKVPADQIVKGDVLATTLEFGWNIKVLDVHHEVWSDWIQIETNKGSVIVHPHTHIPVEDGDDCVKAKDLTLSHVLHARKGSARVLSIRYIQEEGTRVILTCDRSKVFLCGSGSPDIVIHNVRMQNC